MTMTREPELRLDGLRVLLTRAAGDNRAWAEGLAARGAEVRELACLAAEVLPAEEQLRAALAGAGWLVLGSRRGVRAVRELAPDADLPRLACVGAAPARLAEALLGPVALVPEGGTLADLAAELAGRLAPGEAVALATSDRGGRELEQRLEPAGHAVRRVAAYATRPAHPTCDRPRLDDLDAVVLASPSALEGLCNQRHVPADLPLVTLGPTTSAAVRAAVLRLGAEAATRDLDGVAAALATLPT